MSARRPSVSSLDVALLARIGRSGSVVAAARALRISRDRANYRLARLARAFGGPVVVAHRGGPGHGGTALTARGDRIVRGGYSDVVELGRVAGVGRTNRLRGRYRAGPPPTVELGGGVSLRVAFPGPDGQPVIAVVDPEAIVVARRRFASSARTVLAGVVRRIVPGPGPMERRAIVRVGPVELAVALTDETVAALRLGPGERVVLFLKATAVRRVVGARR